MRINKDPNRFGMRLTGMLVLALFLALGCAKVAVSDEPDFSKAVAASSYKCTSNPKISFYDELAKELENG